MISQAQKNTSDVSYRRTFERGSYGYEDDEDFKEQEQSWNNVKKGGRKYIDGSFIIVIFDLNYF
jgi:hypothetical protein